ncbi:MAG: tetratricopeptide repeat protein, partial [Myxococcales bacterium]|nr:tetratricopeptide repeat protein [Myxococcales bacterium]
ARREADAAAAAEQARLANVAAAADAIVAEARAQRRAGWVELYAARLTALRESLVEQRMIGLLADDDVAMRRLAATALGTMGSRRAVPALTQRLRDGVEPDANVIIAIIRALAVIGDPAAEPAVMAARMVPGSNGYIAQQTVLAYQMLPPMPPENPDDPDAWVNFGVALIEKGRLREGIAAYDEALRLDANNLRALNNRGIAWRRNKQYARALADFDRALAIDPQFAKSLLNRATVQRHLNDLAGSTATLDRLIALAEGEGPAAKDARALRRAALSSRAWTRWYANNFPAARADLDAVFAEAPNERQTLAIDGLYWQAAGDLDQAIQRYDRAIDVDSRHPITFQQRARLHEERGDLDAAMADLNEALLLDPDLSQLQAQRARLLLREGKVDAAREAIDAPLSTRPGDAEVYAERAIHFHAAMGDFAAAAADLDRAMERANSGETGLYQLLRLVVARRAGLPAGALAAEVGPPWHRALLDVAAGKHPAADLLAQATSPERRCELDLAAWLTGAALPPPTGFASRPPIALELACPLRERLHAGNQ